MVWWWKQECCQTETRQIHNLSKFNVKPHPVFFSGRGSTLLPHRGWVLLSGWEGNLCPPSVYVLKCQVEREHCCSYVNTTPDLHPHAKLYCCPQNTTQKFTLFGKESDIRYKYRLIWMVSKKVGTSLTEKQNVSFPFSENEKRIFLYICDYFISKKGNLNIILLFLVQFLFSE